MERMAEVVPDSDEQALQHFLSNSPWNEREVIDQVAWDLNKVLGNAKDSALYIDESAFKKQGKKSVGVARQWNGRLGKVDNSQVGVFAALGQGDRVGIVDARLYLPQEWIDDPQRCRDAQVPKNEIVAKSKIDLALEMVRRARSLGLQFKWVGLDGFYGQSGDLLRSLDKDGEIFVADVHNDQRIYLDDPKPYLPERQSTKGRHPTRFQSDASDLSVSKWAKQQPESAWTRHNLRDSSKGNLLVEALHRRVWLWDKKESQAHCWHLIVRREVDSPQTIKYSLSNATPSTNELKLSRMQGQRYWIERAFQDAKSNAGMAHYQARNWHSWHRHMALVMMAMLFMVEERDALKSDFPLLSCYDIQVLLARTLPNRQCDENEIIRQMEYRHKKRLAAIESAEVCQKRRIKRQIRPG